MNNKPNILFVLLDQQRYDCIGYSHDYPVSTPNIDRLASEGMWFENAYTPIPLCCPARQALLNGRRPEAFGGLWNPGNTLEISALEPSEYAWPRELEKHGYRTGYVGKWHVNPVHDPTEYGFHDYINIKEYQAFRENKYPEQKRKEVPGVFNKGEADTVPVEDSRTHWLADRCIELIQKYSDENSSWHIRMDFPEPHLPCCPAGRFADMYDPKEIPEWRSFKETFENKPYIQKQQLYNWGVEDYTWEDWAPVVSRYYGAVSQVDDAIGKILHALDNLGIADNTIVIYTADHGDMGGGHRMVDKHYVMYDDIVKVPLVIRWPGKIKASSRCSEFISHFLDLPPTILEMVGLKSEDFFHGRSMLPLLEGQKLPDWRKEVVATYNGQQFGLYNQRMIRNNKWKYIWNPTDMDELYDLEEDPEELANLIYEEKNLSIVAELREKLYYELVNTGDGLVKSRWLKYQLFSGKKL